MMCLNVEHIYSYKMGSVYSEVTEGFKSRGQVGES
jgi:hypothetical protein